MNFSPMNWGLDALLGDTNHGIFWSLLTLAIMAKRAIFNNYGHYDHSQLLLDYTNDWYPLKQHAKPSLLVKTLCQLDILA